MATSEEVVVKRSRTLVYFDVIYDVVFVIFTTIPLWFLPFASIAQIEAAIGLLCLIIILLTSFHDKRISNASPLMWPLTLVAGIVMIVIALRLEPIWWIFVKLLLRGDAAEAGRRLSAQPHANIFLFCGLAIAYGSVFGFIRSMALLVLKKKDALSSSDSNLAR